MGLTVPLDHSFITAINTKKLVACSVKANDMETNTLTAVDLDLDNLVVDTITANTGNIITVNSTDVNTTNITADNGIFDIITANTGNITTGNITTVNATDVNTTDMTATGDVTVGNDITVTGDGTFDGQLFLTNNNVAPAVEYDLGVASNAIGNLLSYGVVANDTNFDNGPLINQALTENCNVVIPTGIYTVKTTINVPFQTTLIGQCSIGSRLEFSNNTPGFIGIIMNRNTALRNFIMQCNDVTPVIDNTDSIGIQMNQGNIYIDNILQGVGNKFFATGVQFNFISSGNRIFNSRIHGVVTGIAFSVALTGAIISNNELTSHDGGTIVDTTNAGNGTLIIGNNFSPASQSVSVAVGVNVESTLTLVGNVFKEAAFTTANIQGASITNSFILNNTGLIVIPFLPVADPGVPNQLWNNAGVVNISL